MGRKIFVSYKYHDGNVKILNDDPQTIARDYVNKLEELIDESDHIYKGEDDNEDLSGLSEDTIWEKLKDKIYDSTVTIVLISPNMKNYFQREKDQWIPWEISYSLKEVSRRDKNGNPVTSKTNAMIAVVLPDKYGSYSYYLEEKNCCNGGCISHHTDRLFGIIRRNKFNFKDGNKRTCDTNSIVWHGETSYIKAVKWDYFINHIDDCIKEAEQRLENIDNYDVKKEMYDE